MAAEKMIADVVDALGPEFVVESAEELDVEMANTLGLQRRIPAIIYPSSTSDVRTIVKIALKHHVALYPISRGMNIGYGDKLPSGEGHVLLNLQKMNAIREVNKELGYAIIEPGVTQKQLHHYLTEHKLPFWMDATGAGVEASIVGNTLDGGFGHTRLGNHRAEIAGVEAVLGTGEILQAGDFPNIGPDLNGLFVQSNFGVVTAMKVKMLPKPEHYESFVVKVDNDEDLEALVKKISRLRAENVLTSLVHIANATRALVTTKTFPQGFEEKSVTCNQALELMNKGALLKMGYWTAIGSISGPKRVVAAHRHVISKELKKVGEVKFFTDTKIRRIENFLSLPLIDKVLPVKSISESIESLKYIHHLGKGIPSDKALDNIIWRVKDKKDLGLIWLSPSVPSTPQKIRQMLDLVSREFERTGFEMPVTLTSVTDDKLVAIFSIIFDKSKSQEVTRAHDLYFAATKELKKIDVHMYRSSILAMGKIEYQQQGKEAVLKQLKNVLDPQNIISPNRYIS